MSNYTLFHRHDNLSILDGFGSVKRHVKRAKELGMTAFGTSNHGNISSHIEHIKECKAAKIKPILGIELYISFDDCWKQSRDNRGNTHFVIWAKNRSGWESLRNLSSYSNNENIFYYKPRISLWTKDQQRGLESFCDGNIQGFSGHMGSLLSDNLFADIFADVATRQTNISKAYAQYKIEDIEFYNQFLKPNWLESSCELATKLEKMFGKGNFFIELQNELEPSDRIPLYISPLIVNCLRLVSKETGIMPVASSDPHYAYKEDAEDQRAMLMIKMKETEESVERKLSSDEETDVMVFFGSNNFYIHSYEEMSKKFTKEELEATNTIASQIEEYDINHEPYIPQFYVPDDICFNSKHYDICKSIADKYLMFLCIDGAKRIKPWENPIWKLKDDRKTKEDYWNRLLTELQVIFEAKLSTYFLIVWDYCKAADNRPADNSFDWQKNLVNNGKINSIPRGQSRGSAGGCLISYLINITKIDPLMYGLLFGRFYSKGRNTKTHIEYPDIDTDFSVEGRDWVIDYLKWKYGENNVAQIVTFQKMQGRASIKDLFRIKGIENSFELANEISEFIPNEAEISDEIQTAKDEGDEDYNILRWALDHSEKIKEYYQKDELKPIFDQAIRCEGTKRGVGKHPSGVVLSDRPIEQCFPMVYDPRGKQKIIGVDMNNVAKLGGIKMDVLGVAILDKMKMAQDLINANKI